MLSLIKAFCSGALLTVAFLLVSSHNTAAQFNVLSTDTLDEGQIYLEIGSTFKPNSESDTKRFSAFVPRIAYGLTRDVEISLNVLGQVHPGADETIVSPMVKWRFYENEKHGVALALGNNFFIPVRNKSYKFGNQFYAQASKSFSGAGTRITAGGFHYTKNVVAPDASRGGAHFGLEQPLTRRFGLAADWITGKHAAGYFTSGVYFSPRKRMLSYIGYSIGNRNARQGNHYFFANFGFTFN